MKNFTHVTGLVLASLIFTTILPAQPANGVPRIPLWPTGTIAADTETEKDPAVPTVDIYLPDPAKAVGAGVVVLPGGGYGSLSMEFEGANSAHLLNAIGMAAFVVRYRHAPRYRHPLPWQDACQAIRLVRSRAEEFRIDPKRLGIMGYSAGGHLASTVITKIDHGDPAANDPVLRISARPDFAILVYPVITFTANGHVHEGSRANLTGKDQALWAELSSDLKVSQETPPVFLVHGGRDTSVTPENSMLFASACRKVGVSVELHVLSHGQHAFRDDSLRQEAEALMQRWLERNGWLKKLGNP